MLAKLRTVLACVESQSARYATLRSVCHFWILNNLICWLRAMSLFLQISPRKRSFLHNRFSPFIRSPGGFKKCQKISWNYHFKYTVICILHTVYNNNINKYCTKGCTILSKPFPINCTTFDQTFCTIFVSVVVQVVQVVRIGTELQYCTNCTILYKIL